MTNSSASAATTTIPTTTPQQNKELTPAPTALASSPYQQSQGLLKQLKLTNMLTHWEATESRALQQ